ncbi:lipopolysaccharide kinase InaA family protein [Ventosimonas gracilis]|uniref:lipopolysaccharide kinase InaA family protein n=1 Tax=Ventosimonas gracilis TaxID=1680762 RepID=UPI001EFAD5BA|nr:lipopolysaccharide kinase InaA family protein [Ventosimonas gracilis]
MIIKSLNNQELATLLQGAKTIEADGSGLKVAQLEGGDFLKLFRRRRWLSTALWAPPARRFADNARNLLALGIGAPKVTELLQLPQRQSAVRYQPLPGQTLRAHWAALNAIQRAEQVEQFGAFLGLLHEKGLYFRSLHLGNVLRLPDDGFGLIDLSDMFISARALTDGKRQRNLKHMLRYADDANWLLQQHQADWLNGYAQTASKQAADKLARALHKMQAVHSGDN